MKFMLMMKHPGTGAPQILSWAKEDLKAHINYMKQFATKLGTQLATDIFKTRAPGLRY